MSDLRLAGEVINAAKYISAHGDTDVEIISASGGHSLYVNGDEVEAPLHFAAPMPVIQPGQPAAYLDMTPRQIRLGRWHQEVGEFICSTSYAVPEFLALYQQSRKS